MSDFSSIISRLEAEIDSVIVGQKELKRDIIIALFAGGHILLEGAPGLAKTKTVTSFAKALDLSFQRIQFTPDLLPSDLVGAKIYDPQSKKYEVKKGPIFAQIILADEINRAPSKVQSALLEAMEERQVTIGEETFMLEKPFMVLATQNPLEQEGTFHLPEAQLDRFLLKTIVSYPSPEQEQEILRGDKDRQTSQIHSVMHSKKILSAQKMLQEIEVSDGIYHYIADIIAATRDTQSYPEISYGASPRAGIALLRCSRVLAAIEGRDYVIPEDVKALAHSVLRHRIILGYQALASGISGEKIIDQILSDVVMK